MSVRRSVSPSIGPSVRHTRFESLKNPIFRLKWNKIALRSWNYTTWRTIQRRVREQIARTRMSELRQTCFFLSCSFMLSVVLSSFLPIILSFYLSISFFFSFSLFLNTSSHLHERVCLFVGPYDHLLAHKQTIGTAQNDLKSPKTLWLYIDQLQAHLFPPAKLV